MIGMEKTLLEEQVWGGRRRVAFVVVVWWKKLRGKETENERERETGAREVRVRECGVDKSCLEKEGKVSIVPADGRLVTPKCAKRP